MQGGVESTGIATNVAIQGNGFFLIGDPSERVYTRAGNFAFDSTGALVTSDGNYVQGYTALDPITGQISTSGQPGNIVVSPGVLRAPVASTGFGTVANLDSRTHGGLEFHVLRADL
jgi:flagellar hook protein FlgE